MEQVEAPTDPTAAATLAIITALVNVTVDLNYIYDYSGDYQDYNVTANDTKANTTLPAAVSKS